MERACRVILIGMMGAGKSTVGRMLARHTGWPFLDNDALLLELVGKTPRALLAEDGEEKLRASESAALRMGLRSPVPSIVAAAGGVILDPVNRRDLQADAVVIWLKANEATVGRRAMGAAHRPWLDTGGAGWIRAAIAERNPLYASVADLTVEVDRSSSKKVAREILDWLRRFEPCQRVLP